MPRRKSKKSPEYFYFTIDEWVRNYAFEVNRHKWEMSPDDYAERDEILIAGRLRNRTKRKFLAGEAHIHPSYVSRFLAPVRVGRKVRGRTKLLYVEESKPNQFRLKYEVTVEIEDGEEPALIAERLTMAI